MPPKRAKRRKVFVSRPAQAQAAEDEHQAAKPPPPPKLPRSMRKSLLLLLTQLLNLKLNLLPRKLRKTSGGRRRVAPRNATNLTEEEKELVIDFLQQNPMLYSKRLADYKGTAAKDRLWAKQAMQMNRTPNKLKSWRR